MPAAGVPTQTMMDSPFALALLFGFIAFIIYTVAQGYADSGKAWVCKACGFVGEGKTVTRGSLGIEIILWLCFIVPGLIYSVWRKSSQFSGCPSCGRNELIPADSPIGKKLIDETTAPRTAGVTTIRCRKCGKEHSDGSAACPFCGFVR